jgi:hypothetical protein
MSVLIQRHGVQTLAGARLSPGVQPLPDRAVRAAGRGDPLVPAAVHRRVHDVLEHHPVGDTAAVAAQRMTRIERQPLTADQAEELDPDRLQQA